MVILDALPPASLARVASAFESKQAAARQVWQGTLTEDEAVRANSEAQQYFDLPREDMPPSPEAWNR